MVPLLRKISIRMNLISKWGIRIAALLIIAGAAARPTLVANAQDTVRTGVTGFTAVRSGNGYSLSGDAYSGFAELCTCVVNASWTATTETGCGTGVTHCNFVDEIYRGKNTSFRHTIYPADRLRRYVVIVCVVTTSQSNVVCSGSAWTGGVDTTPVPSPTGIKPVTHRQLATVVPDGTPEVWVQPTWRPAKTPTRTVQPGTTATRPQFRADLVRLRRHRGVSPRAAVKRR